MNFLEKNISEIDYKIYNHIKLTYFNQKRTLIFSKK